MNDSNSLFFNSKTFFRLSWKNRFKIRLGAISPASKTKISKSLKDLSAESIRNRFMGSKSEFSHNELEYLTNLDGWDHYALGIEEEQDPKRGIAIVRLVRSKEAPEEAEIAMTIIDDYQSQGLGTFLMRLITLAASERKIEKLTFTTFPQNKAIQRIIEKIGRPEVDSTERDNLRLVLDMKTIDLENIKSQLVQTLPSIDSFRSET